MKKAAIVIPVMLVAATVPTSAFILRKLDKTSIAPTIKAATDGWSTNATISVVEPATFGGSALAHYEYCISDTDDISTCNWKTTSVTDVRVRISGISYVWLRGVSEDGVISDASNKVTVKIDREKPDSSAELSTTTSSIIITISADDDSGIASYMYSINDGDYVEDGKKHTFSGLSAGTEYSIKVKVTDLAGNTKYLSYKQSTTSNTTYSGFSRGSFSLASFRPGSKPSRPTGGFNFPSDIPDRPQPGQPGSQGEAGEIPGDLPDNPELPDPTQPGDVTEPQEPTEPIEPTEPAEPEQPNEPQEPERPEQPTEPQEPTEPVEPEPEPEDQENPEDQETPENPEDSNNTSVID